ncbi:MAG: RNA-directed DNA polymerase [Candidatus Peribacteraceae bacterium]|nr:RNA-directed DNA polymerase [Candidatus Peribacteraceae bacterium]
MKLSEESLNFAKTHIENYYDSDFFYKQFEFDCIWSNWDEVKSHMLDLEISSFPCSHPYILTVPKAEVGFRVVHQLDPINSLIYTALVHMIAEKVESSRSPQKNKVACSYRINIGERGNFFVQDNGWTDYTSRCIEYAKKYKYTLMTDITDFYNHIYIHRLQNSIERCDSNFGGISREIQRYLLQLNNKISRGIPVGPAASIVLAEATLIDVDEYIYNKNKNYTRYVDDFRIFSDDKDSLELLLQDLTRYVYTSHRFNLSSHKTKIISSEDFLKNYIHSPLREEKDAMFKELKRYFISTYHGPQPIQDIGQLPDKYQFEVKARILNKQIVKACEMEPIALKLIESIIRKARSIRARSILNPLIDNFDELSPVMRDVILYLDVITGKSVVDNYHEDFIDIIQNSPSMKYPYVQYWMAYYFLNNKQYFNYSPIREFIQNSDDNRIKAIYAKVMNQESWVRDNKDRLYSCSPQEKRAIIYAATALSSGERKFWMDSIISNSDIIDKSIALYVLRN